ncbi:MAG: hypothetical protein JXA42_10305, partial [Anaerolineales bacterium]|nr:hypothetical protein [Anaerolineales bacterium]
VGAGIWMGVVRAQNIPTRYVGPGMMGTGFNPGCGASVDEWPGGYSMPGPGMGGRWGNQVCQGVYSGTGQEITSLDGANEAFEQFLDDSNYPDLEIAEVMEFEQNYYAIAVENSTGIGAFELLLDKDSGLVGWEPGPNMMWNVKYGMHNNGRMGSWGDYYPAENDLGEDEIRKLAQDWLDENMPGRQAGEPDPFYGYYTLHYLQDGQVDGMLSVNAYSGDVWQHSWHGDFIAMTDDHHEG